MRSSACWSRPTRCRPGSRACWPAPMSIALAASGCCWCSTACSGWQRWPSAGVVGGWGGRGRAMGIVMPSFSVSTVAGVPLGLLLAQYGGWHLPFFAIAALVALLALQAARTLPTLTAHLQAARGRTALGGITQVLADHNHRWAFLFSALLMFTGFTVIPYITIYMQTNAGVRADQVP